MLRQCLRITSHSQILPTVGAKSLDDLAVAPSLTADFRPEKLSTCFEKRLKFADISLRAPCSAEILDFVARPELQGLVEQPRRKCSSGSGSPPDKATPILKRRETEVLQGRGAE